MAQPQCRGRAAARLERTRSALDRLTRLRGRVDDISALLHQHDRRARSQAADALVGLEQRLSRAELELLHMGALGEHDALVEIRPLGPDGRKLRDLLYRTYGEWAASRRYTLDLLHEPLHDDERVLFALLGAYAHGYLELESGMHRLRDGELTSHVQVLVRPWLDGRGEAQLGEHRALKLVGQLGGKVRSRLECPPRLVLQNARSLAENRELAARLAGSFADDLLRDEIVRRYDLSPFLLRDSLIEPPSGKADALAPASFGSLLAARRRAS